MITSSGHWSYSGSALTIDTTWSLGIFVTLHVIETYDVAFTFEGGNKLSLFNAVQDALNPANIIGSYSGGGNVTVNVSGLYNMNCVVDINSDLVINPRFTWDMTMLITSTGDNPGTETDTRSWTWDYTSNILFNFNSKYYSLISREYVFIKQ